MGWVTIVEHAVNIVGYAAMMYGGYRWGRRDERREWIGK